MVVRTHYRWLALAVSVALSLSAGRAAAQCIGDCNGDGATTAGELQKVISIIIFCPCDPPLIGGKATGCDAIPGADKGCTAADGNDNECLTAGELGLIISNNINFPSGCPLQAPTPTPSDTPTATEMPGTETPTPPPTNTPSPTATATATPVCGDGVLGTGETCAQCAADCVVQACTATTPLNTFRVDFGNAGGRQVLSTRILVAYHSARLSLRGINNDATVRQQFKGTPSNSVLSVTDLGYAADVTVTRAQGFVNNAQLFTVDFDSCQGAAAPALTDLSCTVLECSGQTGMIANCRCTIRNP